MLRLSFAMSVNTPPSVTLGQIAYAVENVERSTAFFRDQVGLKYLYKAPPGLTFFDMGGIRLMIGKPQGAGVVGANSVLYLRVPDIQASYQQLKAKGVHFDREPMIISKHENVEYWFAFFRDPDGNLLALISEKAAK